MAYVTRAILVAPTTALEMETKIVEASPTANPQEKTRPAADSAEGIPPIVVAATLTIVNYVDLVANASGDTSNVTSTKGAKGKDPDATTKVAIHNTGENLETYRGKTIKKPDSRMSALLEKPQAGPHTIIPNPRHAEIQSTRKISSGGKDPFNHERKKTFQDTTQPNH